MFKRMFWFFVAAIVLLAIFLPGYTKLQELKDKNTGLQSKIRRLKIENVLLEQELSRVENDPDYQEKIVREKMGIVRKGEVPVKIIGENKTK